MAKEKKDKKKSGIVIVVGTGGPKSPTKTADPCMKKAWAFLKNLPPLPRDDDGESKAPTEEELAAMIGAIERAEPKGPTEEEDDLARQDFARHIGLRPPKLSAEQEYQKEIITKNEEKLVENVKDVEEYLHYGQQPQK